MTDRQETIADIIAWLRKPREGENAYLTLWRDEIADRLEAAWKRERELTKPAENVNSGAASDTAGNGAKLREALETMNNLFEQGVICTSYANSAEEMEQIEELYRKTKSAMAAPPRNCDIYTTEDAVDTATVTVRDECDACPNLDMEAPCVFCMVRWLLAPATAKQGGAK